MRVDEDEHVERRERIQQRCQPVRPAACRGTSVYSSGDYTPMQPSASARCNAATMQRQPMRVKHNTTQHNTTQHNRAQHNTAVCGNVPRWPRSRHITRMRVRAHALSSLSCSAIAPACSPSVDVGRGGPSPGADVAGVGPVPAQMWAGVSPVPAQMWLSSSSATREVGIDASATAHEWERARAADAERRPRDGRIANDERHCGGFRQLQHTAAARPEVPEVSARCKPRDCGRSAHIPIFSIVDNHFEKD